MGTQSISIEQFILAIERLPEDAPRDRDGVWYRTQKEHWLGWLSQYEGPGAYGRTGPARDAIIAEVVSRGLPGSWTLTRNCVWTLSQTAALPHWNRAMLTWRSV